MQHNRPQTFPLKNTRFSPALQRALDTLLEQLSRVETTLSSTRLSRKNFPNNLHHNFATRYSIGVAVFYQQKFVPADGNCHSDGILCFECSSLNTKSQNFQKMGANSVYFRGLSNQSFPKVNTKWCCTACSSPGRNHGDFHTGGTDIFER